MRSASRWIYVAVGCVVLLFSGLVYAWSVLSGPIAAEFPRWTTAQLSLTFTIVMSFFCLGGLTCGALSARISPRIFLWISALLFLAGFLLTAGMRSLPMLYVGFGVVCGLASGFSYNAVLGTVGAWFPDKQGLVSGILLMGFGLSSFLIGKLYQRFTPTAIGSWRRSFVVLGIITAVLVAASCSGGPVRTSRRRPPRKRSAMQTPWQKSLARRPCCGGPRSGCTISGRYS